MKTRRFRLIAGTLAVSIAALGMTPQPGHAGLISTEAAAHGGPLQSERERILSFLDRTDVAVQLQRQGVSVEAAKVRADALTDDEVRTVAGRLEQLPAGGGTSVLAVIGVVFLVLLITDLLGLTNVFPFIKSPYKR
jgi:hypothetical protein